MAAKVFILILSSVTCRYNQQKALKIARRVYLVYWCLIVLLRPLDLKVQQSKIDHRSSASTAMMFECLAYSGASSILTPRLITDHVTPFPCEHTVRLLVKFFFAPRQFSNQRHYLALFRQGPLCHLSPPLETSTTALVKYFWWILILPVHQKFRVKTPVYNQAKALEPKAHSKGLLSKTPLVRDSRAKLTRTKACE